MKKVYIFLADGFEEIEAITPIDVLRRADITVKTVSISNIKEVKGAHGITVLTDIIFSDADFLDADLVILPGGMPGALNLNQHKALKNLLLKLSDEGKFIGAICAAPMVLGELGLLKNKNATCYPGFENHLMEANYTASPLEVSNHIITSKGVGSAMKFALQLVTLLKGEKIASELAKQMVL